MLSLCFAEIERVQKGDTEKDTENYLDLFTTKNIKLKERVLIPVKQYPKVSLSMLQLCVLFSTLVCLIKCVPVGCGEIAPYIWKRVDLSRFISG